MDSSHALRQALEVEPLTAIPASFPEQRARVLRILLKWQSSLSPVALTPAYPTQRARFDHRGHQGDDAA